MSLFRSLALAMGHAAMCPPFQYLLVALRLWKNLVSATKFVLYPYSPSVTEATVYNGRQDDSRQQNISWAAINIKYTIEVHVQGCFHPLGDTQGSSSWVSKKYHIRNVAWLLSNHAPACCKAPWYASRRPEMAMLGRAVKLCTVPAYMRHKRIRQYSNTSGKVVLSISSLMYK